MSDLERRGIPFRFEQPPSDNETFMSSAEHLAGYGLVVVEASRDIWRPERGYGITRNTISATIRLANGKAQLHRDVAGKFFEEDMYVMRVFNQPETVLPPNLRHFCEIYLDTGELPALWAPFVEAPIQPNFQYGITNWGRGGIQYPLFLPRDPETLSRIGWHIKGENIASPVNVTRVD